MIELDRKAIARFYHHYGDLPRGSLHLRLNHLIQYMNHLPYENLSKIISWQGGEHAPRLRCPGQVVDEHLQYGTGGTCFSLTELLRQLVSHAGLYCYPVLAHMRHGAEVHCALRVEGGGNHHYLLDPGYLVPRPLRLRTTCTVPHDLSVGEPFLVQAGSLGLHPPTIPTGDFDLYTLDESGPKWRYRFSDVEPTARQFRHRWMESFFLPGMHSLLITQRTPLGERVYLHNHKLRRKNSEQKSNENIRDCLTHCVERIFGIDPLITEQARDIIHRLRSLHLTHIKHKSI